MTMLDEILEQPYMVRRLLDRNAATFENLPSFLAGSSYSVIAARGTSDNAARYAQYVWGARNRLMVGLAAPSLFGPYASAPSLESAAIVGISQSGESPDLIAVLSEARQQGRPTLTITNRPESPLAAEGDHVIDLCAGEERAVAATKTYTAELVAVAAASLAFERRSISELEVLPGLLEDTIGAATHLDVVVAHLADADRCVTVGRGFHHATAFEWALKLQELSYLLAQSHSAADFLHGPVAVIEPGFPALLVATSGATFDSMRTLADDLRVRGAHVIAISDDADFPAEAVVQVPESPEWLAPIVAAPALQLLSHAVTKARGLDPDAPRGLSKVTKTR